MADHSRACRSVGVSFILLVVESLEDWDGEVADTIHLQGQCLGIPPAESTHHLFQQLAPSGRATLPSVDGSLHDPQRWTGSFDLTFILYINSVA